MSFVFIHPIILVIAAILSVDVKCIPDLRLSSEPPSFCRLGPVNFTCMATGSGATLFWEVNDTERSSFPFRADLDYPVHLLITPPLEGAMAEVTAVSINPNDMRAYDIVSVFSVSDVSVLDGSSIHCEDTSGVRSDVLKIQVNFTRPPIPPFSDFCSPLPSSDGAEFSIRFSEDFNTQYLVERYRVSVTPDPSSCSSEEVRPSEEYNCSGLALGTRYSFTVTAINCGDQEGETDTFSLLPQYLVPTTPTEVTIDSGMVRWNQPESSKCSSIGGINYTVVLEDNTGMIVEQRTVSSSNCNSDGVCSTSFSQSSSEQACRVTIMTSNALGSSSVASFPIAGAVRLTSANIALLVVGVILLGIAMVLILMEFKTRKGSWLYVILLVVGGVLVVVSVVLWVAVGFQVGLQDNTCDSAWQATRDNLIISAFVFSVVAMLLVTLAAIAIILSKKNQDINKLELYKRDKSELGAGGRVKEVEDNIVDEFKPKGEKTTAGQLRVRENIHQAALADDADYSTTQHNIPPVQSDTGTYSQLDTHEAGSSQYSALNRGDGEHGGASKMAATGSGEKYGQLETATRFGVKKPVLLPASDVDVACPTCASKLKSKARHCPACGKKLMTETVL